LIIFRFQRSNSKIDEWRTLTLGEGEVNGGLRELRHGGSSQLAVTAKMKGKEGT